MDALTDATPNQMMEESNRRYLNDMRHQIVVDAAVDTLAVIAGVRPSPLERRALCHAASLALTLDATLNV